LFARIDELRAAGRGILYVSHRMEEIERLADRVSVLRDGRLVASAPTMARDEIVRHMVGRALSAIGELAPPGDERVLGVADLWAARDRVRLEGVEASLHRGELVGVYGLEGSGASLLPHAIFGAVSPARGTIRLHGRDLVPTPARCIARGMILLAGDRAASLVGASSLLHDA